MKLTQNSKCSFIGLARFVCSALVLAICPYPEGLADQVTRPPFTAEFQYHQCDYLVSHREEDQHKMRAKHGHEVDEPDVHPFATRPPWFRNPWAYTFYFILFLGVIITVVYWRTKNLNEHNRVLGEMVEARTRELAVAIDRLKKTQSQLILSEKMASLGQLAAGIAHEINNPLNFISGGVEALKDLQNILFDNSKRISDEERASAKEQIGELMILITRGVERSTSIIKSLRTYLSPQNEISACVAISINESIESSLLILSSKIKAGQITVVKELRGDIVVKGNSSQISQVLVNIIDNAIHALENRQGDRIITIRTQVEATDVIISIADNGTGIPTKYYNKILEPFFTTKTIGKGIGLGLFITFGIIQKHGGKLIFKSEEGKGTEFDVVLPKNMIRSVSGKQ